MNISHMTFIVKDIDRSAELFTQLFNATEVYDSKNKNFSLSREKFLTINHLWIALMEGESLPNKTYNHIAFKINEEEIEWYTERINQLGLSIEEGRSRIDGEASSLYFYDYDNHLFELHTGTLEERLKRYLRE